MFKTIFWHTKHWVPAKSSNVVFIIVIISLITIIRLLRIPFEFVTAMGVDRELIIYNVFEISEDLNHPSKI